MPRNFLVCSALLAFFSILGADRAVAQCCAPQSAKDGCNLGTNGRCYWDDTSCSCICQPTPIIMDVDGSGFQLTSAQGGVRFDFSGTGNYQQASWTASGSTNAFLALDRNGNGVIDDGTELFGNHTPQPKSDTPNGFRALAEYDKPANGGNGDGVIDSHDAIFTKLLLWMDSNHDGVSQPTELYPLPSLGIYSIALDYELTNTVDDFGNMFRLRAEVNEDLQSHAGPFAYDVTLTTK